MAAERGVWSQSLENAEMSINARCEGVSNRGDKAQANASLTFRLESQSRIKQAVRAGQPRL